MLHSKTMGEADKIITLFTRERGKLRALAYGASKSSSRKRGAVQPLCHSSIQLYQGKEIDTVSQCEGITWFTHLRENLEKMTQSFYLCELVNNLSAEGEPNEPLFILLLTTMGWLNKPSIEQPHAELLIAGFEIKMLGLMGYMPQLNSCVNCGGTISGGLTFSIEDGGVVCGNCSYQIPKGLAIKIQTVELLGQLITVNPGRLPQINTPRWVLIETQRVLRHLIRYYMERTSKSLDFLEGLYKYPHI